MKKIFLSFLLVFATVSGFAQSTKTKTKTKTTTTVKKPAATKKATEKLPEETPEQKAVREKKAEEKGRVLTENMHKNLHFSPAQYEEVMKINRRSITLVELARFQYIKDIPKMNEQIDQIGSGRLSLLKEVLTPQQFQKYNQKREEKMGIPGSGQQQQRVPAMEQYSN